MVKKFLVLIMLTLSTVFAMDDMQSVRVKKVRFTVPLEFEKIKKAKEKTEEFCKGADKRLQMLSIYSLTTKGEYFPVIMDSVSTVETLSNSFYTTLSALLDSITELTNHDFPKTEEEADKFKQLDDIRLIAMNKFTEYSQQAGLILDKPLSPKPVTVPRTMQKKTAPMLPRIMDFLVHPFAFFGSLIASR